MTEIKIIHEGPIVKRKDAIEQGLKKFFTGNPCKYGHIDERYVSKGGCVTCVKHKARQHAINNPEMAIMRTKRYREKTYTGKARQSCIEWAKKNPDKIAEYRRNRRAKIAQAEGFHTKDDVFAILERQKWKCVECKKSLKKSYHVDHIMPIALGGSNWPKNLQCLCQLCNNRKHAKHPVDWAKENGRLL